MQKVKARFKFSSINLDMVGFSASTLCAVHCAALPFVLTALPLVGLEFLAHPAVEMSMIAIGLVVGVAALLHGFKHHHNMTAVYVLAIGFVAIFLAHSGLMDESAESVVTPVGASVVAIAHLINWRLTKAACQGESCIHHSP